MGCTWMVLRPSFPTSLRCLVISKERSSQQTLYLPLYWQFIRVSCVKTKPSKAVENNTALRVWF